MIVPLLLTAGVLGLLYASRQRPLTDLRSGQQVMVRGESGYEYTVIIKDRLADGRYIVEVLPPVPAQGFTVGENVIARPTEITRVLS